MMMRASVATAYTTSGLGSGSQSKNSRSYLKLFYVVFCLIVVHMPNFIQIGQKEMEAKKIGYWSALVSWSGQSRDSCIHFKFILFGL